MSITVELAEKLDQAAAASLHAELTAQIGQPISIDGRKVRLVGGLAAQVLLAASRRWDADGIDFELLTSEPMQSDLLRLGLGDDLLTQETQS